MILFLPLKWIVNQLARSTVLRIVSHFDRYFVTIKRKFGPLRNFSFGPFVVSDEKFGRNKLRSNSVNSREDAVDLKFWDNRPY